MVIEMFSLKALALGSKRSDVWTVKFLVVMIAVEEFFVLFCGCGKDEKYTATPRRKAEDRLHYPFGRFVHSF